MNVYEKLQRARTDLQSRQMKKSGHNKFAGYQYFELGDFLPTINVLFSELGLCSTVSFGKDLAELRIVNIEKPEEVITFTSPMESANLKGCHPIQNLGAVETYSRRYLYVTALEIVEHDALDSAPPVESKPKVEPTTKSGKTNGNLRPARNVLGKKPYWFGDGVTVEPTRIEPLEEAVERALKFAGQGKFVDAWLELENSCQDNEEKLFTATFFDSTQRSALKVAGEEQRLKYASDPATQA